MQRKIYEVEWTLQEQDLVLYSLGLGGVSLGKCTTHLRVADYFNALRDEALWPPSRLTIAEMREKTKLLKQFRRHRCDSGEGCVLKQELNGLSERIDVVLGDIEGISIESN